MKCKKLPQTAAHISLDVLTLGSSAVSVFLVYTLNQQLVSLRENYTGERKSNYLPCIRSTLAHCDSDKVDTCEATCCPQGYWCTRSPVKGLYCQSKHIVCGNHIYCRDFADLQGVCKNSTCRLHKNSERHSYWAFLLSCIAFICDMIDIIFIFVKPDWVKCKSMDDIVSSALKLLAFGVILAAGTSTFLAELQAARCFNDEGAGLVDSARTNFIWYCVITFFSFMFSLLEAPVSAYFGGRLTDIPYVKDVA
eukprot:TRINITY_DN12067_c0_g3_i1.p1 TRINITY_DN12067_c0_g3~~TRINITY_DN12067_c0_g3_i1.p1  ORF type:complete len:251 (-),score=53.76 TRINITY_DN12067_c0_g3_i1:25-777(-)